MIAEVISIGDELTSGQRLDTNSKWLSERLGELGVTVRYHTTVADDLEANVLVFRQAAERVDVVVATGGLGPTADDLTREALAKVAGVDLVLDQPSLAHIRGLFARHNREMPERNLVQAMFPAGSRPIFNPRGTAPGVAIRIRRADGVCRVFALPGVPAEMFEMYEQTVMPALRELMPERRVLKHRRIKCFGAGESQVEQMLPDLIRRGREPSVGITVHAATITLRVTAVGENDEQCETCMLPTLETIRHSLGTLVFGEEDDELQDVVARLLAERGERVATSEFGSSGMLAQVLSETKEAEQVFAGGSILTNNQPTAADNAGGKQFVVNMAEQTRDSHKAIYGLAVGPFPNELSVSASPQPYWYALATPEKTLVRSATLVSHPAIWKPRAAKQALNLLRLWLLQAIDESAA